MPALPLWARALRGIDRLAWYTYHAHEIARDELLFALLQPELRSEATVEAYSKMRTYLPGGATFEEGLFGWEEALLEHPLIPRAGRVLLAAAGGGRELKGLLARGFAVTAFEPNPVLFQGARQVAAGLPSARLLRASYADLIDAAADRGPLRGLAEQPFDVILFGWGSFTHLTQRELQLGVLRAVRKLAPHSPLALSFFVRAQHEPVSRSMRMRSALRSVLARAGNHGPIEPGLGYDSGGGFVYSFTLDEMAELATAARYRIAFRDTKVFPHVILTPVH